MAVAHHLFLDLRYGDGALYACLVVLVLLLGSRVYGGVRHLRGAGERLLIVGTSPPARLVIESRARGIRVEDVVETYESLTGKRAIELISPSRVIFSPEFATARVQPWFARALSLMVAVVGLIVLAPLMALIALAIKLDSRGPVFFVQQRAGRYRLPFNLIKFRTMRPVTGPHSEWARDSSDRITRCGRWLRRFRLDELPQLINMVRGDMNLVGPRPLPMTNLELLVLTARNYALRCSVRPGITGWAQVRYRYANSLEQEVEKIRYDFYYLKHLSVWLDIRILFETVRTTVAGHRPVQAELPESQ